MRLPFFPCVCYDNAILRREYSIGGIHMKLTRLLAIVMALCLLAAALPLASAEEEVITLTIARKTDTLIENLETNETTKAIEE